MCSELINEDVEENKKLLILGAGGHGKVVKETVQTIGSFSEIDFLDDNSEIAIGICSDYKKFVGKYKYAFIALGNPELRQKWLKKLIDAGYKIPIIIHPTAYVSPSANIGIGSFIGINAVVNTGTIVEKGCIVGIGALVDHDCYIGEYSYINAGGIVRACSKIESFKKVDVGVIV